MNPIVPTNASISIIDSATAQIEIVIEYDASKELIPTQSKFYDVKARVGSSVKLISSGKINILPDVTNNI